MGDNGSRLVGDVGGTNARFAISQMIDGRPSLGRFKNLHCKDYPSMSAAIAAYFEDMPQSERPAEAVIAVAGPVTDGSITFTNLGWRVSETELRETLGFRKATLINDYAALALAAPVLGPDDLRRLGPDVPGHPGSTVAILGAGTGFGASALVRDRGSEAVLTTEGGHIGFAPIDALESEVRRILSLRYGRVSVERLMSGPGLLNLYTALLEIEGLQPCCETPDEVTRKADDGDATALRTVQLFCDMLGSVAGDFALVYGALGGVFIAGGVAPKLMAHLDRSDFRRRFEAKGRFHGYLSSIPTFVITQPHAALLGSARG
jgi:glucokinase